MIICKIQGGIGNQLFQYAVGLALSEKNKVKLKFDISSFENAKQHNGFRLSKIISDIDVATKNDIKKYDARATYFGKLKMKFNPELGNKIYYEAVRHVYDPEILSIKDGCLIGYWQNEKYFRHLRKKILNSINLRAAKEEISGKYIEDIQNNNSVAVHVRRGDYLNHPEIGTINKEYYKEATEYLDRKFSELKYYVFSDDLDWCEKNFSFLKNAVYIRETYSEIDDLFLMSSCNHNVIANSTFSWWAAWLNTNDEKIVIAPKNWRADDYGNDEIIPESWLKL